DSRRVLEDGARQTHDCSPGEHPHDFVRRIVPSVSIRKLMPVRQLFSIAVPDRPDPRPVERCVTRLRPATTRATTSLRVTPIRQVTVMSVVALTAASGFAVEPEAKEFKADGKTLPYRLLKPADTEAGKKYPLVIFLHGAGECGVDNKNQLVW